MCRHYGIIYTRVPTSDTVSLVVTESRTESTVSPAGHHPQRGRQRPKRALTSEQSVSESRSGDEKVRRAPTSDRDGGSQPIAQHCWMTLVVGEGRCGNLRVESRRGLGKDQYSSPPLSLFPSPPPVSVLILRLHVSITITEVSTLTKNKEWRIFLWEKGYGHSFLHQATLHFEGYRDTPSSLWFPDPLGVVVPVRVTSMGRIDLFFELSVLDRNTLYHKNACEKIKKLHKKCEYKRTIYLISKPLGYLLVCLFCFIA